MWEANKIAYRGNSSYKRAYRGSTLIWEAKSLFEGLTFTAEKAGSTVKYTAGYNRSAEYSYDTVNWSNADGVTITLNNVGDKVYFRGSIWGVAFPGFYAKFEMTGLIAASGNINSMNEGSDVFKYDGAYRAMFTKCTSLTKAPELPATTLATYCYANMFDYCTSLTTAPELPATTLKSNCYYRMFRGCTSLNNVTTYATEWNTSYTSNWLSGVSSTGDFYNLGGASIPRGTSGIPSGWTEHKTLD